jgi:hypothetical protein
MDIQEEAPAVNKCFTITPGPQNLLNSLCHEIKKGGIHVNLGGDSDQGSDETDSPSSPPRRRPAAGNRGGDNNNPLYDANDDPFHQIISYRVELYTHIFCLIKS